MKVINVTVAALISATYHLTVGRIPTWAMVVLAILSVLAWLSATEIAELAKDGEFGLVLLSLMTTFFFVIAPYGEMAWLYYLVGSFLLFSLWIKYPETELSYKQRARAILLWGCLVFLIGCFLVLLVSYTLTGIPYWLVFVLGTALMIIGSMAVLDDVILGSWEKRLNITGIWIIILGAVGMLVTAQTPKPILKGSLFLLLSLSGAAILDRKFLLLHLRDYMEKIRGKS